MRHKYSGIIEIEPAMSSIYVQMRVIATEIADNEVSYYINKNMRVHELSINSAGQYELGTEIAQWSPFFNNTYELKFVSSKNENLVDFNISYSGIIDNNIVNGISEEWVELGIYAPWFLLNENLEEIEFEVEVKIKSETTLNLLYPKNKVKVKDIDFPIFASTKHEYIEYKKNGLTVGLSISKDSDKKYNGIIQSEVFEIIEFYNRQFGDIKDLNQLDIVIAPRLDGGGYCRSGLIVLTPEPIETPEEQVNLKLYLAHELAHIWWQLADKSSWEDWLNESFAEYSALLFLESSYGNEAFAKRISQLVEKSANLPCIYNMERVSENSYDILNYKGPYILNMLRNKLGAERFEILMHDIFRIGVNNTSDLLALIEKFGSVEDRNFLEDLLMK